MTDLLGPGAAGAARTLTTTTDVTYPATGDTFFQDCVSGTPGTGTPDMAQWNNKLLQQVRRVIRNAGVTLNNADDDMLGRAIQSGALTWTGTFGGSANALTATLAPAPSSLIAGLTVRGLVTTANTGAATLNCNSLGAVAIVDQLGAAMPAGALFGRVTFEYDGTAFRIVGGVPQVKRSFTLLPSASQSSPYNQSIPNNVETAVTFSNIITGSDPLTFFSAGSPTIVTVPAGITTVRVSAVVAFSPNATGYRQMRLLQNGGAKPVGGRLSVMLPLAGNSNVLQVTGFPVACAAGDTFGALALQNSGGALTLDGASTTFTVEW